MQGVESLPLRIFNNRMSSNTLNNYKKLSQTKHLQDTKSLFCLEFNFILNITIESPSQISVLSGFVCMSTKRMNGKLTRDSFERFIGIFRECDTSRMFYNRCDHGCCLFIILKFSCTLCKKIKNKDWTLSVPD